MKFLIVLVAVVAVAHAGEVAKEEKKTTEKRGIASSLGYGVAAGPAVVAAPAVGYASPAIGGLGLGLAAPALGYASPYGLAAPALGYAGVAQALGYAGVAAPALGYAGVAPALGYAGVAAPALGYAGVPQAAYLGSPLGYSVGPSVYAASSLAFDNLAVGYGYGLGNTIAAYNGPLVGAGLRYAAPALKAGYY